MPRSLQVIAGCFPIAQTRDPYMAVKFIAERIPLQKIYNLKPLPESEAGNEMLLQLDLSLCVAVARLFTAY